MYRPRIKDTVDPSVAKRDSGIKEIGDLSWGTHFCQFYHSKKDLTDILVPYFKAGLESNEHCVWVTSEFLTTQEAIAAMEKGVPDFQRYLENGQMEIFPHTEWYLKGGKFEMQRVLNDWVKKHDHALEKGFSGIRVSGNPFWIDNKKDWRDFERYEAEINNVIDRYRILVLCTYSLEKCGAGEVIDVVSNHEFALIKKVGKWETIESAESKNMRRDLEEKEDRLEKIYSSMSQGMALHEVIYANGKALDYRIIDVNSAYEKITGLKKKDAIGKKASELYGTGVAPYLDIYEKVASSRRKTSFEVYFSPMRKHFTISVFSPMKGKFVTLFSDITERKNKEQRLENLNRIHRALSDSSHALMRIKNEKEFLNEACRIIVEDCGHAMVWIGYAEDNEDKTVAPIAYAGFDEGYVKSLNVTWADTERGQGPTGTAIRTKKISICKDMVNDPAFRPWRKDALKRGYSSSIVLPLLDGKKVLGAISIYSVSVNAFSGDEIKLLKELADDISYGIKILRLNEENIKNQELRLESEEKFRSAFVDGSIPMAIVGTDSKFIKPNPAYVKLLGYEESELIGHSFKEFTYSDDLKENLKGMDPVLKGKKSSFKMEKRYVRKDGKIIWVDLSSSLVRDAKGGPLYVVTYAQDITAKKEAEEILKRSEELAREQASEMQALFEETPAIIWMAKDLQCKVIVGNKAAVRFLRVNEGINMSKSGKEEGKLAHYEMIKEGKALMPEEMPLQMVASTGKPLYNYEVDFVFNGQEIKTVAGNVVPIHDKNGKTTGSVGAFVDVTERKKTEEALHHNMKRFKLLSGTADALLKADDPRLVVDSLCKKIMQDLDCQIYFNYLTDEISGCLSLNAFGGISKKEAIGDMRLRIGDSVSGMVVKDGKMIVVEDVQNVDTPGLVGPKLKGIKTYACLPLFGAKRKVIGTLSFGTLTRDKFSKEDLSLMKAVADQVATAILRKKTEEQMYLQSTALNSAANAIVITNRKGEIEWVNHAFEKLTGYMSSEVIGKNPNVLKSGKMDESFYGSLWKKISEGLVWHGEIINKRKDGGLYYEEMTIAPVIVNGEITNFIAIKQDVTKQKELERRKDDFINIASHELKTPLTSIKVYAQVLENSLKKEGQEMNVKFIQRMNKQINTLQEYIQDLLDVNKIQMGKLPLKKEEFDLNELIEEIVSTFKAISPTHSINYKNSIINMIIGDREKIGQVLNNLLTNAIKYSPKADRINIVLEKKREEVVVLVEDFGLGIPKNEQPRIFDRFFQVDGIDRRKFPGLGLGLFISKNIIEYHGGRIWVKSREGKGSKFFFSLPLRADA